MATYRDEILNDVKLIVGSETDFTDEEILRAFAYAVRYSNIYVEHGMTVVDVDPVSGVELAGDEDMNNTYWLLFIWGAASVLLGGKGLSNVGYRWRSGLASIDTSRRATVAENKHNEAEEKFWEIVNMIVTYGKDIDLYDQYGLTSRSDLN